MRYKVNNGNLEALSSKLPINPLSAEIENFKNGDSWAEENDGFLYIYVKINNENILINKMQLPYLIFSSDSAFTLLASNPRWDGTIEYSLDEGNTWTIWDGTTQLSGDENNPIYLRGIGNTKISGSYKWSFTGKYITGNIETLLDYQTVANGNHPTMSSYCYGAMFVDCTSLIIPPELPATILASYCYSSMFGGCTSLTTLPKLPATILNYGCYHYMFSDCTSLKLSTTQTGNYQYPYRIPTLGTGTDATAATTSMFSNTGGTFTGAPTINTTYWTDHQPI